MTSPKTPRQASSKVATKKAPAKKAATKTAAPARKAGAFVTEPTPLLGGLSPQAFMQRHWQKKPLLIRQAMPGVQPPLDRKALFELAESEDVESRLIVQPGTGVGGVDGTTKKASSKRAPKAGAAWQLHHGPFPRRALPAVGQPRWTLLVQGLDLHVPAAGELLRRFRFVPDARLDDLMISYATDGGGVGPHFDSYDVFLLQVHGRRRWRIGRLHDDSLQPDVPLKILNRFEAEEEWVLEPGDMLYLPPRWAHDGIAEGECMTCSIGFRAPGETELVREMLLRVAEGLDGPDKPLLYQDPKQPATQTPGLIPDGLARFASAALAKALADPAALASALGEVLTEPKPRVWFEAGEPLPDGAGVRLDPRTRMVYDERRVFANGESWQAAGQDARHLRRLADERRLDAATVAKGSAELRELLDQWAEDGWLHPEP